MALDLFPVLARLDAREIPAGAYRLLTLLIDLAESRRGYVIVATETQLAAATGLSVRTVRENKAWLIAAGLLVKGPRRSELIPTLPGIDTINAQVRARQSALAAHEKPLGIGANWHAKTGKSAPVSTPVTEARTGESAPVSDGQNRRIGAAKPANTRHKTGESAPKIATTTTRRTAPGKACKAVSKSPTSRQADKHGGNPSARTLRRLCKPHPAITLNGWLAENGVLALAQLRTIADHLRRTGALDAMLLVEPGFLEFSTATFCKQQTETDHEHTNWPRRFCDFLRSGAGGLIRRQPQGGHAWTVQGAEAFARFAAPRHQPINGAAR
ncbi:helix-turn-helix domain-containing protein [Cupriavidus metallidurans]|uniref:helix-turn-helix domain-containing protein n=1 Tax=Cupriavidus metallidurans TaxID=119219 RepID=UPI001BFC22DE|nr:helix-turn-helix domain-containing protein [Cupriavidus metallidurans]QWC87780.1 hypothetical protein KB891_12085 [Cupriavidus metallidurans]